MAEEEEIFGTKVRFIVGDHLILLVLQKLVRRRASGNNVDLANMGDGVFGIGDGGGIVGGHFFVGFVSVGWFVLEALRLGFALERSECRNDW